MRFVPRAPVLVSAALHIAIVAAFFHAMLEPRHVEWTRPPGIIRDRAIPQIRHVVLPTPIAIREPPSPVKPAAASQGPRLHADPPPTPEFLPAARTRTPAESAEASGIGAPPNVDDPAGVVLRPTGRDPRLWSTPGTHAAPAPARAAELEGTLSRAVSASNDSILKLGVQTVNPDWVVTRNGNKFGIDNTRIYLGRISVPAVVLGLLPIPDYGCMPTLYRPERAVRDSGGIVCITLPNPGLAERGARMNEMSAEIRARSDVTLQGRQEIERIAARKERERAARLRMRSPPP